MTDNDVDQAAKDAPNINKTRFHPSVKAKEPTARDIGHFDGINIRNFPSHLQDKDICTFLINLVLPAS